MFVGKTGVASSLTLQNFFGLLDLLHFNSADANGQQHEWTADFTSEQFNLVNFALVAEETSKEVV